MTDHYWNSEEKIKVDTQMHLKGIVTMAKARHEQIQKRYWPCKHIIKQFVNSAPMWIIIRAGGADKVPGWWESCPGCGSRRPPKEPPEEVGLRKDFNLLCGAVDNFLTDATFTSPGEGSGKKWAAMVKSLHDVWEAVGGDY